MNDTSLTTLGSGYTSQEFVDTALYTGEVRATTADTPTGSSDTFLGETGSSAVSMDRSVREDVQQPKGYNNALDVALLQRALGIISEFGTEDPIECAVGLEGLRAVVLGLWESASGSNCYSQDILAMLESALLSIESLNLQQVEVFREALRDLKSTVTTESHVDILRRRFISVGFSPLALLTDIGNSDTCDE